MAKLPVYQQQNQISTSRTQPLVNPSSFTEGTKQLGNAVSAISQQWQEAKDYSESLEGKNKLNASMSGILSEAENYKDYKNPKELQEKEIELLDQMGLANNEITAGFTNNLNANKFNQTAQVSVIKNKEVLKGIFRGKYIDNAKSNLFVSQQRNQENYISTGDMNFKESYATDLDDAFKAGYINELEKTKLMDKTNDWENYKALRDASNDPDAALQNLKDGNYDIQAKDYNDVLSDMKSLKSNKELMDEMSELQNQDTGETNVTDFINSNDNTYDKKLQQINEQEFLGNVSTGYATKARRMIKKYQPEADTSNADAMSDVLQRVTDLQNSTKIRGKDYLIGVKNVRQDIISMQSSGKINTKDATKLNNQISQLTRKKISETTDTVGRGMKDARDYINKNLPPEYRNEAIRNTFYATSGEDTDAMGKKDAQKFYLEQANSIVQEIKNGNREFAYNKVEEIKKDPEKSNTDAMRGRLIKAGYSEAQITSYFNKKGYN